MIDFRYHLVSIVAVLLALAAGVVLGSGFVGGPLLDDIERRADDIRATNTELRQLADERLGTIASQDDFATEVEPHLTAGALEDARIVVIDVQGTDRAVREAVRTSLVAAGASLAGSIELKDRLALDDDVKRDELALALGSTLAEPDEVLQEAATTMGTRLATAAGDGATAGARNRLNNLLESLEESGFVATRQPGSGPLVPPGAGFVVITGGGDPSAFAVDFFVTTLAAGMGKRGSAVLVTETQSSEWGVIGSLLGEGESVDVVSTASGVDLAAGRIAAVLALGRSLAGEVGHYGTDDGAGSILPEVPPTPSG